MTLPLSTAVLALYAELKTLAREGNPYLFPARHGSGHRTARVAEEAAA